MAPFRALTKVVFTLSIFGAGALAGQVSKPGKARVLRSTSSNLFSSPLPAPFSRLFTGNRVSCGVIDQGETCTDPSDNGVIEGAFWPNGTPDSYLFNSGLQLAGLIPASAGFAWAGDTVGVFFYDPRGDQGGGTPLTGVYDSRDTTETRAWPVGASIYDTSAFSPTLLGLRSVSDEDLWTRFWDGNPQRQGGRTHPMGVAVDERAMAFNRPGPNADILYFVYTITNITASDPAVYASINPLVRGEYAALGAQFKHLSDSAYGVTLPTAGFSIDSVFLSASMDPDVGRDHVGQNYSTVSLPFATGFAYEAPFSEPSWSFPAEIFGAAGLAPAPGLVGLKYLRFAKDPAGQPAGVRIFTNHTGSGTGYPDPVGVKQLYRYLSGTSAPAAGDNPCSFQGFQIQLHYCYLAQVSQDTRFDFSSGPFTLGPGQQQTIVLAYVFAPPRDTIAPYIGGDLKPGFPSPGDSIAADSTKVRLSERVAGWVTQSDANADGVIEENEVTTWPGSLLHKAHFAQAFADAKFVSPQAPAAPNFFLVPGDKQVTVVWQKSTSETTADPYFLVASDPTSPLYDPNFRQFAVEGYRVYRGLSPNALQLVAQFDYAGTVMSDYAGDFDYGTECAPELGILTGCPVAFPATPNPAVHVDHPLNGYIVQVPPGGRLRAPNGAIQVVHADTAPTGGNSGFPPLVDNGVTFSYLDAGVLNSFPYYYSVTAFDINSIRSGPSSLESPRFVKRVTPRTNGNVTNALIVQGMYGDDSVALNPLAPYPAMDTATGTFSGPLPPVNGWTFSLLTSATQILPRGRVVLRIDSVAPGFAGAIAPGPIFYFTLSGGVDTLREAVPLVEPASSINYGTGGFSQTTPLVVPDSILARRFGGTSDSASRIPVSLGVQTIPVASTSPGVATVGLRYGAVNQATAYLAHSRWFDEGKTEPPDPTIVGDPSPAHNSGLLTGVASIWAPQAYRSDTLAPINVSFRGYSYAATSWYPADFTVRWNADSSVSIRDQTHHLNLPLAPNGGPGFGFVNVRAFAGPGVTAANLDDGTGTTDVSIVSYHHLYATSPVCSGYWGIPCIALERKAQFEPLDFNSDGTADANGVVLVVNGEAFFMAMTQLPAAGTQWHLRAVTGNMTATCSPSIGPVMTDCSAYTFNGPAIRPALVPGLQFVIDIQRAFSVDTAVSGDLSKVHTVPDPFYVTNALAVSADTQHIEFVHLPTRAIIRIYSVSGRLVALLTHNDVTGGGQEDWNVRSRDGKPVASGVYFYQVEGPDHRTKVGRFTVVTYRP